MNPLKCYLNKLSQNVNPCQKILTFFLYLSMQRHLKSKYFTFKLFNYFTNKEDADLEQKKLKN